MNVRVSLRMPSAVWLVIAAVHCLAAPHPPESVPNRAYFYVHTVADLDKTIAFYRDVIGLREKRALSAFPSDKPTRNSQINSLTNTPNAFFRPIYFELPGNDYGLELLEFTEIERKAVQPRQQDPGATFLILDVRNLDALLAKAKMGGATVVTEGGKPAILLRDPDGFYLLLRQPRRIPVGAAKGPIGGAGVAVTVADLAKATAFYGDMLGLVPGHPEGGAKLSRVSGVAGAQIVTGSVKIAGSTFEPQLWEFRGVNQQPIHPRMQDPGAPQFTLQFHVPAAARAYLKKEGVQFLSEGVIYDPNGVLILVRGEPPNN
jgi:catechol 2,3-dioxygenase-like lactoylglutathione lyase family enzyme